MLETKTAEKLGFDPEKLQQLTAYLDKHYVEAEKFSGYAYLIARHGEIASLICRGKSAMRGEAADGFAIAPDSIFRIYSMTKPLTSLGLMMLVEQGKVQLDDPLKNYIPAFADTQIWENGTAQDYTTRPLERDLTLHDLLTHQSGLTYDFVADHPVDALYRHKQLNGARNCGKTLEEFVDILAQLPLLFAPGTGWNYSLGLDVIGRVIEIVANQPLDIFFKTHLLEPLGMVDTDFDISPDKKARLTHCYYHDANIGYPRAIDSPTRTIYDSQPRFLGGGGGLLSTLNDYYRFCRMLRADGTLDGKQFVKAETLALMRRNQLAHGGDLDGYAKGSFTATGVAGMGFGIGWSLVLDADKTQAPTSNGTYAWGGLANTNFWIDPVKDLIVIFLAQTMPYGCYPIREEFAFGIYGAIKD